MKCWRNLYQTEHANLLGIERGGRMTESWMGVKEASTAQTSETFDRVQARQSEHYGGETRATKGACLDVMST